MSSGSGRSYTYQELLEVAQALEERQASIDAGLHLKRPFYPNIYVVVQECSTVHQTRGGSDTYCSLRVIDPSCAVHAELQHGVEFRCFIPPGNPGPLLRKPGDILRLHRVKAELFAGRLSLSGRAGMLTDSGGNVGTPCSFCLFHGDPGAPAAPYQSSHTRPTLPRGEVGILENLRSWGNSVAIRTLGQSEYTRIIRDIRPGGFFDILCLVLSASPGTAADGSDVVYVWDSTDAIPFSLSVSMTGGETSNPNWDLSLPVFPDPKLESSFPAIGTALPIVFHVAAPGQVGSSEPTLPRPPVGSWVNLRNVGARVVLGQLQGFVTARSKWAARSDLAGLIIPALHERVAKKAVCDWAGGEELRLVHGQPRETPWETLRSVRSRPAPASYKVLVQVIDYAPRDPHAMWRTTEGADTPEPGLQLLLRDATAMLAVNLSGSLAMIFFFGAARVCESPDGEDQSESTPWINRDLTPILHKLCGVGADREGGVWVEMCLQAYQASNGQRQYRIVCTSAASLW